MVLYLRVGLVIWSGLYSGVNLLIACAYVRIGIKQLLSLSVHVKIL